MLNVIDKQLLKEVADLEGIPKGAYNIRKNGKLVGREVSANINIETNPKGGRHRHRYRTGYGRRVGPYPGHPVPGRPP